MFFGMDSALTPREIQDRLRSGAGVADVAAEAGVTPEEIEGFAVPILAEREHITDLARTAHVRRAGDSPAQRGLEAVITEELRARGVEPALRWDAVRVERRRWQVSATVADGDTTRVGVFNFDVTGRFSVAANPDARWMIGETPLPPVDEEAEPTLELDDDEPTSEVQVLHEMMSRYEETVAGYEDTIRALRDSMDRDADGRDRREPDQPPLVDDDRPAPRRRPKNSKKRAQVPSWDEIVFGEHRDS